MFDFIARFLAMAEIEQARLCSFGLSCELKRFCTIGCKHLDNVNAMTAISRKGERLLALFACGKQLAIRGIESSYLATLNRYLMLRDGNGGVLTLNMTNGGNDGGWRKLQKIEIGERQFGCGAH